jgi:CheY-like chemotaxis protein
MTAPRIVLLSNDDASLAAMHALLTDAGYRTLRCRPRDVTDAHAVVKRAKADLVILDLRIAKREDGWAFLARMCADLETMDIPAIIASGQMERLPQQDALLRTMACHVLVTPFDTQELLTAIGTALSAPPATRAHVALLPEVRSQPQGPIRLVR